jgi:hypothetical protein
VAIRSVDACEGVLMSAAVSQGDRGLVTRGSLRDRASELSQTACSAMCPGASYPPRVRAPPVGRRTKRFTIAR